MDKDLSLSTPVDELENRILSETNVDDLNDIIDIFNLNLKKKDIIRSSKLSEIQDKVVNQMYERVDKRADEFSNKDLIQLHKTVQETIDKGDNSLENVKIPTISINQINVASEPESFDRESRERIISTVNSILASIKEESQEVIDVENVEVEEN